MNNIFRYIYVTTFLIGLFCFLSCSNDELQVGIKETELSLNLTSPSGTRVAESIMELKYETAMVIAEVYGMDKEFEIMGFNYLPSDEGYIVLIDYKTEDDITGTYAISKDAEICYSMDTMVLKHSNNKLRSGSENGGSGSTKYVCKPHGRCHSCTLQGVYNPSTGENIITCSCDECKMEITYS